MSVIIHMVAAVEVDLLFTLWTFKTRKCDSNMAMCFEDNLLKFAHMI